MTGAAGVDPVEAMDRIQVALVRLFDRLPGAESHHDRDALYGTMGVPIPPLNTVCNLRLGADADTRIDQIDAWFAERRMPSTWFVGPADTPSDLPDRLLARGLEEDPEAAPGLMATLDDLPDEPVRDGLLVERIADRPTWVVACRIVTEGFGAPPELGEAMEPFADLGFDADNPQQAFLVRVDGEPAATCLAMTTEDALGIFNVATVPALRRRGAGRAATLAAMSLGRERGCAIALLQTSMMGRPVYERLGFRDFGRYQVFVRSI